MTSKTAATRYARALLDVGIKERANLEQAEQELAAFAALLDAQPTLKKVLLNPAVPVPRKRAAVADLMKAAKASPTVSKLLVLLAERDRLLLLPDLIDAYRNRLADDRQIVGAEVTAGARVARGRVAGI